MEGGFVEVVVEVGRSAETQKNYGNGATSGRFGCRRKRGAFWPLAFASGRHDRCQEYASAVRVWHGVVLVGWQLVGGSWERRPAQRDQAPVRDAREAGVSGVGLSCARERARGE